MIVGKMTLARIAARQFVGLLLLRSVSVEFGWHVSMGLIHSGTSIELKASYNVGFGGYMLRAPRARDCLETHQMSGIREEASGTTRHQRRCLSEWACWANYGLRCLESGVFLIEKLACAGSGHGRERMYWEQATSIGELTQI
ncbi:uncharacterized protein BDZ83DRAFT_648586 [Colletotrichum acutatum]|uniref:Secreted protein n=1 Tax=Glomerella acutata TaxID=27357 RepID=A0AAD8XII1_GLOAC|nr:uncharacterized protein BDZ83DRAFT_648586 [Colletotrichum acutatum]KAK1728637.1 hypothetical protein BDZ83DRAFT_648586 [Colletotrichum acutatum]